jgi:hypothetical protein
LTLDHTPEFTLPSMTDLLHLPAQSGAPIACDMSSARDTPDERLAEYAGLFERALVRRERHVRSVMFAFRATPGTREQVEDLARREAACCPFLDYRVHAAAEEVLYTITNPVSGLDQADADATLDAFYALPDHAGSGYTDLLDRLAGGGADFIEAGRDRWELRKASPPPGIAS